MPPEQFDNGAGCDERSDIYSFGIVLYQMAAGGQVPFPIPVGADWQAMQLLHRDSPVPRLDSPLFPIIQRCLEKSPEKRYETFTEVRRNLELLLQRQAGEVIIPPQLKELEIWEWNNKGGSLYTLGRYEEAIPCLDKALELDPRYSNAWTNKGNSLDNLGHHEEAILCYDKALELDPSDAAAWYNKGTSRHRLGSYEEAICCYDKALEFDPRYVDAWSNKALAEDKLSRWSEAGLSYGQFLALALAQPYAKQVEYARKRLRELGG
jgi:tetratricopeptide (TPR) repeat protein